eukprot:9494870-Pyramimonas_sp.AAC.1
MPYGNGGASTDSADEDENGRVAGEQLEKIFEQPGWGDELSFVLTRRTRTERTKTFTHTIRGLGRN